MIQTLKRNTFLTKLHPLTKMWMTASLSFAILVYGNIWTTAAMVILSVFLLISEKMFSPLKGFLWVASVYSLFSFTIHGLVNPLNTTPLFVMPVINMIFYSEGIYHALNYFNRIVPIMAILITLFGSVNMTDLGAAMQKAGIGHRWAYIFTSTFQLIPILNREREQIMNAQRARGLNTEGNMFHRAKAFLPVMMPVVANSIMSVQQRAISLLTKGFVSSAKKTVYRDFKKNKIDHILKFLSIFLIIFILALWILMLFQ